MKLTEKKIKQLIQEEIQKLTESEESLKPGDFVQISMSGDGYDVGVEKVDPSEYSNTKSPYQAVKALAKIEKVAGFGSEEDGF